MSTDTQDDTVNHLPIFTPARDSRIAVVGGCGGMGQALVRAALAVGLRVAVLDLQRSRAESPVPEGALGIPCDVSDEASVQAAFAALHTGWGALDTLVDLVGFTGEQIKVRDMPTAEWDSITDTCLRGMFLVTRAALPLLERGRDSGRPEGCSGFVHAGRIEPRPRLLAHALAYLGHHLHQARPEQRA